MVLDDETLQIEGLILGRAISGLIKASLRRCWAVTCAPIPPLILYSITLTHIIQSWESVIYLYFLYVTACLVIF